MSEATETLTEISDNVDKAEGICAWIAAFESDEDKARTLADNEVLSRVADKIRDVAAYLEAVENGDIEDPNA